MRIAFAVPALLVFMACSSPAAVPSATPSATSAPATPSAATSASPTPSPAACAVAPHQAAGAVLYSNDLLLCRPGPFGADTSDSNSASPSPTGYRVLLKTGPGIQMGIGPDPTDYPGAKSPDDARVEVDAQKLTGSEKTFVGFECRLKLVGGRVTGGYSLVVSGEGNYAIARFGASPMVLASGGGAPTVAGTNHLMAECLGNKLALFVNGKQVASVQDNAISSGLIGIYARTQDAGPAEVLFTNFVVTSP